MWKSCDPVDMLWIQWDLSRYERCSATTMGITNLWQVISHLLQLFSLWTMFVNQTVKPTARNDSLADYSMYHTVFESNNLLLIEPQIIGIDARWFFFIVHTLDWQLCSIWMHECQAAFFHPCHPQMGENPELYTLFYHLAALLQMPIIPVFIFDGPNQLSQKHGRTIITQPHWMTDRFKEFIEAFGFYYHMVSSRVYLSTISFADSVLRLLAKPKLSLHCSTKFTALMQSSHKTATHSFLVQSVS